MGFTANKVFWKKYFDKAMAEIILKGQAREFSCFPSFITTANKYFRRLHTPRHHADVRASSEGLQRFRPADRARDHVPGTIDPCY